MSTVVHRLQFFSGGIGEVGAKQIDKESKIIIYIIIPV